MGNASGKSRRRGGGVKGRSKERKRAEKTTGK